MRRHAWRLLRSVDRSAKCAARLLEGQRACGELPFVAALTLRDDARDRVAPGLGARHEEHLRRPAIAERARVSGIDQAAPEHVADWSAEEVAVAIELGHRRGGLFRVPHRRASGLVLDEEAPLERRDLQDRVRLQPAPLEGQPPLHGGAVLEGQVQVLAKHPAEAAGHPRPGPTGRSRCAAPTIARRPRAAMRTRSRLRKRSFPSSRKQSLSRRASSCSRTLTAACALRKPTRRRSCAPHSRAPAWWTNGSTPAVAANAAASPTASATPTGTCAPALAAA